MDAVPDSFMEFISLGSGSGGNAFAVRTPRCTLLVDAGFSCREMFARLQNAGIEPESIRAVLLTHDHVDHSRGCRVLCDKLKIPLYTAGRTAEFLDDHGALPARVFEFEPGAQFMLEDISVRSFPVSHDASAPVGFVLHYGENSLGIATDLGIADDMVRGALSGCRMLVFECNYDDAMLAASSRPPALKQRIRSRRGHLGNTDAMAILPELIGDATRMLTLVHVSRECNDYSLVSRMAREMLERMGRSDIYLDVALQDTVRKPFSCRKVNHGAA